MTKEVRSNVFLHPDGYVELVMVGLVNAEEIEALVKEIRVLLDKNGSLNLLVDGRNGRVERNARSFSAMLSIGRVPNLKQMFIVTSPDPNNPLAIHGPGIVTSILTSALGFRPTYLANEAEARARARQ